jgi:hypothetical protein
MLLCGPDLLSIKETGGHIKMLAKTSPLHAASHTFS